MSKQTIPPPSKPTKEAPAGKTPATRSTKGRLYRRQTARVEERRDGKPLLFGWGKHLSRRQKDKIQKRAFWTFAIVVPLIVISVLGYAYYDLNYRIPGEPIVTVNGHIIPQSLFRKLNFYLAQDVANQLAANQQQQNAAQALAGSSDPTKQAQGQQELNNLQTQQQVLNQQYAIPTVGAQSVDYLIDDELIQEQIPQLEAQGVPASVLEASDQQINAKLQAFTRAIPSSNETYQQFLSASKMSEDDFRQILAIVIRHDNMDMYQQSLFGPTGPQVHASLIQVNTEQDADAVLAQLQSASASDLPTTFAKLAKQKSKDANTRAKGGDMGWVVYGGSAGALPEQWLFDPARKVGDLSPVINVVSEEYNIYYISAIDPHRPISASTLQTLKSNALSHWIGKLKALPQTTITDTDTTKELDPNNFPANLPSGAATDTGS